MEPVSYQKLVEEFSDIATVIDSEGTITYVSPAVEHTLGYEPEELVGEVGYEYQHPDDREAVADAIEAIQANPDQTKVVETRFQHADGSWCWIEATVQNRLEDEDIGGILMNSRDISDRKRREKQYEELGREYETLLDTVEDGIFFLDVESDDGESVFRFERLNQAYEEQTGLTTEELKGKTPVEVFGDDLGAELQANYHRCVKAQEPITYQEEIPVETGARFWQTNLAPVVTDGDVTQIIGITRNVTERVTRERKLERHKTFLEHSPVAIAVVDETGEITYQSFGSTRVTGRPPDELLGESGFEYIHPDDQDRVVETFTTLVSDPEGSQTVEYRLEDGDGNWRWIRSTATNYLEDEAIEGIVVATINITEQKKFESRLKRQLDNLDILSQIVRHDIRNDLQLVTTYTELLEGHVDEKGAEYLERISESAENAVAFTKSARDLSEVMLQTSIDETTVPLESMLLDQIEEVRAGYDQAVIQVDGTIPRTDVIANSMLSSVFRNLLNNAIQHNDKAVPEVTASAEAHEEYVTVRVADNGPGVPDTQKEEIFGKGEQGLKSEGTGIGLYLVQSVVDKYGGDVWVEDNEPEGSVFVVKLRTAK